MRKLVITAATLTMMSAGLLSGMAAADGGCPTGTIANTGPDSENIISCSTTTDTHVTCINNIYVVGENGQAAYSGDATGQGNTTGGPVVTGSATNDNNQTVNVGASCGQVATAPVTPTPETPGQGGGETTTPEVTSTPTGAVHAGGGAGAQAVSGLQIAGLIAALSAIVAGVAMRFRVFAR